MVQSLQRHPSGHGAIPDHAHNLMFLAQLLTSPDHAERSGDPCACVPGIERIVFTFFPLTEPAQPAVLPQRMKLLPASSEKLMRITLIAGIPDDLVGGRIQEIMQRNRQFYDTQVRRQVSADGGHSTDNLLANFLGQGWKVIGGQPLQIGWTMNVLQNRHSL